MPNANGPISAGEVYTRLAKVRRARQEHLLVLCLDTQGRLIKQHVVSKGILDSTMAHPREVFYPAIRSNASAIIIAHNHPSGDSEPSESDMNLTIHLAKAGFILGIELVDHVIVAKESYTSLREEGLFD